MLLSARCLCGGVELQLQGPTEFASHCHCPDCRRAHAAAFVTWTSVPEERFQVVQGADLIQPFESSPGVLRGFCRRCGSSVTYRHRDIPGRVYLPAALLAELDRPVTENVCYDERAPWLDGWHELPCYRGLSDSEEDRMD